MASYETDYLVVGAGAIGMAFVDSLLDHGKGDILLLDRHPKPGGHWNASYPFVTLHQPSVTYGLSHEDLGDQVIDQAGPNKGMYELATGAQVNAYFDGVMRHKFLPTGRVNYQPMTEYLRRDGDTLEAVVTMRQADGSIKDVPFIMQRIAGEGEPGHQH